MENKNPLQTKGFHLFGDMIGLNFTILEKGYSQCVLNVERKLMNPHNTLHGGVIYSLADTGMGAALYLLLENDELCSTVEIKIAYFKPVREGTLTCDTKVIYKGKNFSNLESEIRNGENLVSKATGTFSIFKVK
ncbi:MAG: PaaI family thioesterase [Candidatus Hermodarchaeota archaeon]